MTGSDTIAAVSTAPGEGGVGIIRISGGEAERILGRVFAAHGHGRQACESFENRKMYYGHIIDPASAETVDEVLVVFMKGPRSYTGEDVCEIQCHGGIVPLRRILGIVCGMGASPAQPGEFTKRAFLNGRLDLVQAGAVIDLIRSRTEKGYHAAKEQAEGRLSERVGAVRGLLLGALAEIAVRIDYPEAFEGSGKDGPAETLDIDSVLAEAGVMLDGLIKSAEAGRIVKDGVRVAIVGKPNTGKSSLFNALAGEDAAIVTATPGTTRDALEVWLDLCGVPVLLIDTAGIRESRDEVEALGVGRAREQYQKADAAIFILDGSIPLSSEDEAIARLLDIEKKLVLVINKADLPQAFEDADAAGLLPFPCGAENIIRTSFIGEGRVKSRESAEKLLERVALRDAFPGSSLLVTKERHRGLLESAAAEITEARDCFRDGAASEFAEVNIRNAWNALGEITGETASDDVIDRVFEEFCVGK